MMQDWGNSWTGAWYESGGNAHLFKVCCRPRVPPASPVIFDVQLLYIPGASKTIAG